MIDPIVVSFPRSGSTFFISNFRAKTGTQPKLEHAPIKVANSISCVRNPIDSIASLLTMDYESLSNKYGNSILEKDLTDYAIHRGHRLVDRYAAFYKFLENSDSVITDYETFSLEIDRAVLSVANALNISLLETPDEVLLPNDDIEEGYLVASRNRASYEKCFEIVNTLMTDDAIDAFNAVKKMSCLA